jgi:hypothetical protein
MINWKKNKQIINHWNLQMIWMNRISRIHSISMLTTTVSVTTSEIFKKCIINIIIHRNISILLYVPLKNFTLTWRRHHRRWRAAKFRHIFGAQGLWAERDFYRATPAVTRGLGFSSLVRPIQSPLTTHKGM